MKGDVFEPNALVFAKIRGYPAWPARVTGAVDDGKKPKKYTVFFFGTYEVATVKVEDLFAYNAQSKEKYGSGSLKRKGFVDAMREIEETPDIEVRGPPPPQPATPRSLSTGAGAATPGSTPKPRGRGRKRKEDASTPLEPAGKRRRLDSGEAAEAADADMAEPQLSRSGRKIKPKRFADEEGRKNSPAAPKRAGVATAALQAAHRGPARMETAGEPSKSEEEIEAPLPMEEAAGRGGAGDGPSETSTLHTEDEEYGRRSHEMADHGPSAEPEPERRDVRYKPYPCHETEDIIRVVDSASVQKQEDGRKVMYVKAKCGEMLEIDISDRERPKEFKSEKARIMWDTATAINLARLRHQLEQGECIPDRLREKLLSRADLADDVKEKLKNEKRQEMRKSKLWWLRDEARLIELDYHIKLNLIIDEQNHENCIKVLEELSQMNMAPLMLKKNPEIVETVRKCRKYTGSAEIRALADKCYQRFKRMFVVPAGKMFREHFDDQLAQFRKVTEEMPEEKVIRMVRDPLYLRPGEASSDSEDEPWPPTSPHTNGAAVKTEASPERRQNGVHGLAESREQPSDQVPTVVEPESEAAGSGERSADGAGGEPAPLPQPGSPQTAGTDKEQPASEQPPSEQSASEEPASEQMASEQVASEQPASKQPASEEMVSEEVASEQPASEQVASEQMAFEEPASEQPASEQVASEQPEAEEQKAEPPPAISEEPPAEQAAEVISEHRQEAAESATEEAEPAQQ